jgi:hypothetical protein
VVVPWIYILLSLCSKFIVFIHMENKILLHFFCQLLRRYIRLMWRYFIQLKNLNCCRKSWPWNSGKIKRSILPLFFSRTYIIIVELSRGMIDLRRTGLRPCWKNQTHMF